MTTFPTREQWLNEAILQFRGIYETHGLSIPARIYTSCGLPSRGAFSPTRRVLGQCWHPAASTDGSPHIFISPVIEEGLDALGVLLHELVHSCLTPEAKHGPVFKAAAHKVGLTEGKPKSAAPGKDLTRICEDVILNRLGKYPHAALLPPDKIAGKADKCRMIKIACANEHEEYVLRGSRKVIALGLPDCPICGQTLTAPEGMEE